jgi:hypothetical protein
MWVGLLLSFSSPRLSYSIWVPAFAGMSGIGGYQLSPRTPLFRLKWARVRSLERRAESS